MALAPIHVVFPSGEVWTATAAQARIHRRKLKRTRRLVERERRRVASWFRVFIAVVRCYRSGWATS